MKTTNKTDSLNWPNLIRRYQAPTPAFWEQLSRILLGIAALGAAMLGIWPQAPDWIGSALLGAGTLGRLLCHLTTTDPSENDIQPQTTSNPNTDK